MTSETATADTATAQGTCAMPQPADRDDPALYAPWRQSLPAGCAPEDDPLRLRLDLHDEVAILHDYGAEGLVTSRVVAMEEVMDALAGNVDLRTGLLPRETLWAVGNGGGLRVAIWRGPRVWTARLVTRFGQPPRAFRLPLPGLVFICLPGPQAPYVYAAKRRPRRETDTLFRAPVFNIFDSGRVCVGSHVFPEDPDRVPEAFFASFFSAEGQSQRRSARHPDNLLALWEELDGRKRFPLGDLVPQFTVADAMRAGTVW